MEKLYWVPQLPNHWIAQATDNIWYMFPNIADGWKQRTPYKGHVAALKEVQLAEARLMLQFTGAKEIV